MRGNRDVLRERAARWERTTVGAPASVVIRAMNAATPGINWSGSPVRVLKIHYLGTPHGRDKITDEQRTKFHVELAAELRREWTRLDTKFGRLIAANEFLRACSRD